MTPSRLPSQAPQTERLLAAVRARLWRETARDQLAAALWVAAAVALAGGAIHLGWRSHSGTVTAAFAALPVLAAALAVALRGRPSEAWAARAADDRFGTRALLTSALDQLRRPASARAGGAGFVLARAEENADEWRARLPSLERPGPRARRRVFVPVILLLAATYLHVLPGAAGARGSAGAAATLPAASPVEIASADPAAPGPMAEGAPSAAHRTAAEPGAGSGRVTASGGEALAASPGPSEAPGSGGPAVSEAGAGTGGREVGAQPAAANVPVDTAVPVADLPRRFVDVAPGAPENASGEGAWPLDPPVRIADETGSRAGAPHAAGPGGVRAHGPRAPALRAYSAAVQEHLGLAGESE
ncbi:MAG: hypothetical protein O7G30_11755 [Proteobacteria bacterium]|nr:hypothetical protein [Pseudomonadota bacterium]